MLNSVSEWCRGVTTTMRASWLCAGTPRRQEPHCGDAQAELDALGPLAGKGRTEIEADLLRQRQRQVGAEYAQIALREMTLAARLPSVRVRRSQKA
jgi:hypothetical protein